ncbi:pyruvate kinase [Sulfurimonas sp. HSL1-6]|uniref:pyruvate kinase n=1 Tax=Thiomicrolovo immobilis TaxID=3131935 RepID=UPI0031F7C3BA
MLDRTLMQSALDIFEELRSDLLAARHGTDRNHPHYRSLLNLRQYLILRSKDWTELQEKLFLLSLSSLGRSYAHVAASVDTLYDQLSSSLGRGEISPEETAAFHHLGIAAAQEMIAQNSRALFGGKGAADAAEQTTAVMVTLPSDAARNGGELIRGLSAAGVNLFRINTAHDDPAVWQGMADVILALNETRPAEEKLKIFVDLAGPKIRTGRIRRLKLPVVLGSNKREKTILIRPLPAQTISERTDPNTRARIPGQLALERSLFDTLEAGDVLKVTDINGRHAKVRIMQRDGEGATGVISKKVAVDESCMVAVGGRKGYVRGCVVQPERIRLFTGDTLRITATDAEGCAALKDETGKTAVPAQISCTLPAFASYVRPGDRVYIDDGKIGLSVHEVEADGVLCRVTQAKPGGTLLKEEKGINLPDTYLNIPALTPADRENLRAVKHYADIFGLSFCQTDRDVADLQALLQAEACGHIGIVPKIETRHAVFRMPRILEQLLLWERSGVMIARGDLAIETGFENLATIQESLLDLCSAAHLPVIWATQVLESQMKNNLPSRAEITDAAMAGRAECVMLNKGPFAIDTAGALLRILEQVHQSFRKNRQLLRKEMLWSVADAPEDGL